MLKWPEIHGKLADLWDVLELRKITLNYGKLRAINYMLLHSDEITRRLSTTKASCELYPR